MHHCETSRSSSDIRDARCYPLILGSRSVRSLNVADAGWKMMSLEFGGAGHI